MKLNGWICFVTGLWKSVQHRVNMSGHEFIEEGTYDGCTVQVLKCECCGEYSITWKKGQTNG